ncbi:hypothetical protein EJD97_012960, partial [Solanum chilense]
RFVILVSDLYRILEALVLKTPILGCHHDLQNLGRDNGLDALDNDLCHKFVVSITYSNGTETLESVGVGEIWDKANEVGLDVEGHEGAFINTSAKCNYFSLDDVSVFLVEHVMKVIKSRVFERLEGVESIKNFPISN